MIQRDPAGAAADRYDLIVIGGGVYGIMLTLEAARRGLRPLLLEQGDFGGRTSWNSLRIVHGGLRYLQSLDVPRLIESVGERRWFLRTFPEAVRPLPCLMPLHSSGLKRPAVLWLALAATDLLSPGRNDGVPAHRRLAGGRLLSPAEATALAPAVARKGLRGAALWYDAAFVSSQRVLMEALHWACGEGAVALNYVEVTRVLAREGRVVGVEARDLVANVAGEFHSDRIANCTGPALRAIARSADRDLPSLFQPSLAFNLLLDRPPLFEGGLAVQAPRVGARMYFLVPWGGRVCAGTYHAGVTGEQVDPAREAEERVSAMLDDLNEAVPGWDLGPDDLLRVLAGLLPTSRPGSTRLATRPVIYDHGAAGGPAGLVSVSGVKFTTARLVAERALVTLIPEVRRRAPSARGRPAPAEVPSAGEFRALLETDPARARAMARELARSEAVMQVDDLLLRRSDWGILADTGGTVAERLADVVGPTPSDASPAGR